MSPSSPLLSLTPRLCFGRFSRRDAARFSQFSSGSSLLPRSSSEAIILQNLSKQTLYLDDFFLVKMNTFTVRWRFIGLDFVTFFGEINDYVLNTSPRSVLVYEKYIKYLRYSLFQNTLPKSSVFVNWISVRFYETDCNMIFKLKSLFLKIDSAVTKRCFTFLFLFFTFVDTNSETWIFLLLKNIFFFI